MNPEISKLMKEMREKAEKVIHCYSQPEGLCRAIDELRDVASPANILKLLDYFEREAVAPVASLERVQLPPLDVIDHDREAFRAQYEYKYPYSEEVTLGTSLRCRERQLLAEIKVSAGLRSELKAMTEDRNLWRDEHNGDCPNGARVENLEAELQSLRERQERALACLRCSEDKKHAKMAITILTQPEQSNDEGKEPK